MKAAEEIKREEMYNADNETTREEMYKSNVSLPPADGADSSKGDFDDVLKKERKCVCGAELKHRGGISFWCDNPHCKTAYVFDADGHISEYGTVEQKGTPRQTVGGAGHHFASKEIEQPTAEGAEELQKLMTDISEWSNKTFGDGQRNPAIVYHLKKEVNELIAVFEGNPRNAHRQLWFEYADCLMLLLDSALHAGFTARDLIDATREKLEINKTRKWGKPDENGVIEHVEQPQPTADGAEEYLKANLSEGEDMVISDRLRRRTKELMNGFAPLHAQKIADKMVEERLKNAPKNCPKAAQCAHVEGGMKCPPNVICPI